MINPELKQQLDLIINDYALKLKLTEQELYEKSAELKILRRSISETEKPSTTIEPANSELALKCSEYTNQIQTLEENLAKATAENKQITAQVDKLTHKNTSKLYTIILLCIISVIAIGIAFISQQNNSLSKSISKTVASSLDNNSNSSKPTKSKSKKKHSVTPVNSDSENSATDSTTATQHDETTTEATTSKEPTTDNQDTN